MTTKNLCKASKPNGSRCEVTRLADSEFCYFHDPSIAAERHEARVLGGQHNRMKTLDEAVPDVKIENSGDVMVLLSQTINQVRKGIIDPRVANAVGYLANLQIKTFEQNELEKRIAKMEAHFESRIAALSRES